MVGFVGYWKRRTYETHDRPVKAVDGISFDIAVMKDGKIIEAGRAEDVLERPRHAYTQALLAAVPRVGSLRRVA